MTRTLEAAAEQEALVGKVALALMERAKHGADYNELARAAIAALSNPSPLLAEVKEALRECRDRLQWVEDFREGSRNHIGRHEAALLYASEILAKLEQAGGE